MRFGVESRRLRAIACALAAFLLTFFAGTSAAKRAADLGPEVPLTQPSGGYVGQLKATPVRGPAGTPLIVTGEGFPAGQEFDLVWRTVKGRWKVTLAEYHGR